MKSDDSATARSSPFGDPLPCGRIVRFRDPDTDFDEALAAGPELAMEHFAEIIAGLREGHAEELRRLGFFDRVSTRLGVNVEVGSWEEIEWRNLDALERIVDEISPPAGGLHNLLEDLRRMIGIAREEGCSLAFML